MGRRAAARAGGAFCQEAQAVSTGEGGRHVELRGLDVLGGHSNVGRQHESRMLPRCHRLWMQSFWTRWIVLVDNFCHPSSAHLLQSPMTLMFFRIRQESDLVQLTNCMHA